jgi:hypothetical protein
MTTSDPRLRKVRTPLASPEARKLLKDHKEAIVITVNPDMKGDGEVNLAVYTKLANEGGVLATYLEQVLKNLMRTRNDKQAHRTGKAAPTGA